MSEIISFLESKTKTVKVGGYSKRKNARSAKMGKIRVKSHTRGTKLNQLKGLK